MDLTKTMEIVTASADVANQAAETALLASEKVVSHSSQVSDDVRRAVQSAIRAASPPRVDPDEDSSSLIDHLPLILSALTLSGVVYLSLLNEELSQRLDEQIETVSTLEEQMEDPTMLIMTLAESNQRIEELLAAKASGKRATVTTMDLPLPAETAESVEAEAMTVEQKAPKQEPLPVVMESPQMTASLELINQKLDTLQTTLIEMPAVLLPEIQQSMAPVTSVAATPSPSTDTIGVTIEAIRASLQQELTPLQHTLASMESGINQQFTELKLQQPAPTAAPAEVPTVAPDPTRIEIEKPSAPIFDNRKPRIYRFP